MEDEDEAAAVDHALVKLPYSGLTFYSISEIQFVVSKKT